MPIKPELRSFYGAAWRATVGRIRERAGNCCEQCAKPNGELVYTITDRVRMFWRPLNRKTWRTDRGDAIAGLGLPLGRVRLVRVVLTVAHLDRTPGHDDDDNLRLLCLWCHLHYDRRVNVQAARRTRQARNDAARPLLQEAPCS